MDKYEYKIRSDEIKALIAEGEFAEAVSIADTIDWRRVKSVMMLCTISDLYKINRRYQESKDILLLAYEKHPTGRLIVYSLCELSIKMEEYVQAIEYYKEFVQIAPKDTGRYILQYRLYEAQDVSLEERIAVLEEFKKRDYREKWAYELAYLYHRIGLSTKCVEECDEMSLWFGEGKYVIKALELKALHEPLTAEQEAKYKAWTRERDMEDVPLETDLPEEEAYGDGVPGDTRVAGKVRHTDVEEDEEEVPLAPTMELPEVKTVDLGQYNTINLQMALAESMKEILDEDASEPDAQEDVEQRAYVNDTDAVEEVLIPEEYEPETEESAAGWYEPEMEESIAADESPAAYEPETEESAAAAYGPGTEESAVASYGPGAEESAVAAYEAEMEQTAAVEESGSELSEENAGANEQAYDDDDIDGQVSIAESLIAPLLEQTMEMPAPEVVEEKLQETPVIAFPGKTEPEAVKVSPSRVVKQSVNVVADTDELQEVGTQSVKEDMAAFDAQQILEQMKQEAQQQIASLSADMVPGARTGVLTPLNTKPSRYDDMLSQEYDGQISLVMPEAERIEKQITGQLSIEDIMAEWEEMKKSNEQRRMEKVKQRILDHTGNLFADFDEATKNGLLEELERAFVAAIMKDSSKKSAIRQVVLPEDEQPRVKPHDAEMARRVAEIMEAPDEEPYEDAYEDEAEDEIEEAAALEEELPEEAEYEDAAAEEITVSAQREEEADAKAAQTPAESVEEPKEEDPAESHLQDRELTPEETELFGQFTHHRKSKRQLVHTLDNMSLASCTGNVVITGEEEITTLTLAKALIKEMQSGDSNFSGKVAKISANILNKKDVAETFAKLDNGALIIEKASRLKPSTVAKITKVLEKDNMGLLLLLIDKKQSMNQLFADHTVLNNNFNLRIDIEPLDDEALVAYAKQYAEEQEYSIDEFGILALHTRIADMQTSDHEVSMSEVRELVDEAIYYANKKTPKHFMDILLAKRYDDEDMIILREKDFMHY